MRGYAVIPITGFTTRQCTPVTLRHRETSAPRELLQATGILLLLVAVFLWKPLTSGGAYAPTDLLQSSPLLRTAPEGQRYRNLLLTDPVQQMIPWFDWNKAEVRDGRLPTWNPYNGNGVPHLANDQTAAVSPFGLPLL